MIPTIECLKWVANGFFMMPHQLEAAKKEALQMIEHINKLQGQVKSVGLAAVSGSVCPACGSKKTIEINGRKGCNNGECPTAN